MIRNESEYKDAVRRLVAEEKKIASYVEELSRMGLDSDQLKRAVDPLRSFHLQLSEEVQSYEKLKRREIQENFSLRSMGHALICLRIALGMSQRELADK